MPGQSARPFRRTEIATHFLRIARTDWARVKIGEKREYREAGRWAPTWTAMKVPQPVVGYSYARHGGPADSTMLVLEECRLEPLGAIAPESLEAEGFDSYDDFRGYWKNRHPRAGFRPLSQVYVYRVRPMTDDDRPVMADRLLVQLYGGHLAP